MNSNVKIENKLYTIYIIVLLLLIYCCELITVFAGSYGRISLFEIGSLTIPSIVLFLLICFLAIWKRNYYFLFLVFVILAFPSPIDDIFPSVALTNPDDKTHVIFPLITRIDLYLILGVFLRLYERSYKISSLSLSLWAKLLVVLYFLVLIANAIGATDLWDLNLLLAYSFHIRYLILILLLLQLYDIRKYQKPLIMGVVLSLIFLLLEAIINTYMKGSDRLLSGSLSLNTFANISAAAGLYMIYLLRYKLISRRIAIITLVTALTIVLASGTRAAILTLILSYFILYLLTNYKKLAINLFKVLIGVGLLVALYVYASGQGYIPERYSYEALSEKISIDFSEDSLAEIFEIETGKQTNSIKSRLDLFDTSFNMIQEDPFFGIGAGRWNRYKNKYSRDNNIPKVLLDTHNDYLALLSQYGIPLGILFAWGVFFMPFYRMRKFAENSSTRNPLTLLYVINFAMGIAALSNAGFFKHQVAALLLLITCISLNLHKTIQHD